MARFSIRDLMIAFALISLGAAPVAMLFGQSKNSNGILDLFALPLFLVSGPLIGTGLLLPIKKAYLGAAIGVVVQVLVILIVVT